MSRTTIKRLARLESLRPIAQRIPRYHVIHGETHEEADANHAALIASGEAEDGDRFLYPRLRVPHSATGGHGMRQSIVSRVGCLEGAQRSRVVVVRSKALTDERVRNALAAMTVEDTLDGIPSTYGGEQARAVFHAAFRADH